MSNSFVAQELAQCPVCGITHTTGILIHKRMRDIKDQVTHQALCPKDQEHLDNGFIALIEVNNLKDKETLKPGEADRTGVVMHLKRTAAEEIFNKGVEDIMFITPEVTEMLKEISNG